jgi:hypothetical protein
VDEFQAEPACHAVAVVNVTPAPLVNALPLVIQEAHKGGVVVNVHVGVVVKVGVVELVGVMVKVSAFVPVDVAETIIEGV